MKRSPVLWLKKVLHRIFNTILTVSHIIMKHIQLMSMDMSLLQKQMNSSRFGGFRTADGASQANKNHHNPLNHPIGGGEGMNGPVIGGFNGNFNGP